jgi:hypothetical protein
MRKTNKSQEKEARKLVTQFSHEFYTKFKVYPTVTYDLITMDLFHLITLDALVAVTDELLNKNPDIWEIEPDKRSITAKCRKTLVVTYRGCMVHIARRLNYSYTILAKVLNACNHTPVLHNYKKINDLLDVKDIEVTHVYKELENELKTRYGIIRDVQSHSAAGTNTQSVLPDVLHERGDSIPEH